LRQIKSVKAGRVSSMRVRRTSLSWHPTVVVSLWRKANCRCSSRRQPPHYLLRSCRPSVCGPSTLMFVISDGESSRSRRLKRFALVPAFGRQTEVWTSVGACQVVHMSSADLRGGGCRRGTGNRIMSRRTSTLPRMRRRSLRRRQSTGTSRRRRSRTDRLRKRSRKPRQSYRNYHKFWRIVSTEPMMTRATSSRIDPSRSRDRRTSSVWRNHNPDRFY
jgi:hypothetical protein